MQARGWFSTPISCGALAGVCAGAVWTLMILQVLQSPPRSVMEFFNQNALRAAVCLGVVLCAPAIYHRDVLLTLKAAAWSLLNWLGSMVCGYLAWVLAARIMPGSSWEKIWRVYEVINLLTLCPILGGMTGYFLARIYGIPKLRTRAIRFGVLGCAVHLLFGLFFSVVQMLGWNLDSPESLAMHTTLAILGYVFLGVATGVPFDTHFRDQAEAGKVAEGEGLH